MDRKGIIAGGNWIIDIVKMIDVFPAQESLADILSESTSNGGSPYNMLIDCARMGVAFPLEGIGLVGHDEKGDYIISDCKKYGINTEQIFKTGAAPTSYTDVMTSNVDGKRTFFHNRGANAFLDLEHFDLGRSNAKIFHLAYLMLLDRLDEVQDGKTNASILFAQAKALGFKTSTDMVSAQSDQFKEVVTSSLPFVDYLFINELEAQKITGIATIKDGEVDISHCIKAMHALLDMGVNDWVILHFPLGCIAISSSREIYYQGSVKMPPEKVAGKVGAGDAFAAGVLAGLHDGLSIQLCLQYGVSVAASCLLKSNSSEGVKELAECMKLGEVYGFQMIE